MGENGLYLLDGNGISSAIRKYDAQTIRQVAQMRQARKCFTIQYWHFNKRAYIIGGTSDCNFSLEAFNQL